MKKILVITVAIMLLLSLLISCGSAVNDSTVIYGPDREYNYHEQNNTVAVGPYGYSSETYKIKSKGEMLDKMFEYTCAKTIRASHNKIYIMLHAGDKEMFNTSFEDEVVERLNKQAYLLFECVNNSVDRAIFASVEKEVLQFIKDYKIEE